MSIRVALRHITRYQFDRPVALSPHVIRLRPAPHSRTPIRGYNLRITPKKHFINWQQDPFGNWLARLVFPEPTRELSVDVEVIADLITINPFDFFLEPYADKFPFTYPAELAQELQPYREIAETSTRFENWVESIDLTTRGTVDFLVELNQKVQRAVSYTIRMEPGVQSCEETLTKKSGSCRDSAWLLVQILRRLGLAARFVSGYLAQLTPDEKALDGPSGPAADFTDLHAWTEVYLPGAGWVGLDPTSGLFAGEGHIPLAATPMPSGAAPIDGMTDPCEVEFEFSNHITRIAETPRVTKPFTPDEWAAVNQLGHQVDARLRAGDVRLTMGGEPTFIAIDNTDAPEWNTEALGLHKRELAEKLWRRLHARFAPGGLLHSGQGKWYPGEPLPRWALGIYWRRDGHALWRDPRRLAHYRDEHGHTLVHASNFAKALAAQLGLHHSFLRPGYEDALYYLWQEAKTGVNVDLSRAEFGDDIARRALADKLSRGLDKPVGYALPIAWDWQQSRFTSGPWRFRRDRMYLTPGDSPMGLRLPLDSLPWNAQAQREVDPETDPFAPQLPLPDAEAILDAWHGAANDAPSDPSRYVVVPHMASCIEVRNGVVHVFMPPLTVLEQYVLLLSAVERAAEQQNLAIVIEGYPPPRDPRLEQLHVTPDPGVIEVNVHPATSWEQMVATTETLYEEARMSRLASEKFMVDGRHTGTGGGNHVTIGGATPADSPWLRRPDLLQSVITYWQHHPALSYFFSGLFIGPTSQAPRVDEARRDQLYELQVAFAQTPLGEVPQPWLVDRILRNLLVDVTGNTHRAELCIDKLYSPDGPAGRQGLVEFRGMEMPPHPHLSALQMLLIRALIARFWETPYHKPLVDWGTELHDRYMLPHYLWQDLGEILEDLRRAGFEFKREWFAPFLEFRFPKFGATQVAGVEIEVRGAIEPWYVLGEESSNRGTARFVDSSVERVQVKLTGLTDSRYVLTCNRRRVPLRATGRRGEFVAGVRYRAWQPPSALHPTIGVHAPLVFDLYDTWNKRSVGGCTYHVMHAGGRSYETYPINAFEAESRRIARFAEFGHSPPPEKTLIAAQPSSAGRDRVAARDGNEAADEPVAENPTNEFPSTLDLRRPPLL